MNNGVLSGQNLANLQNDIGAIGGTNGGNGIGGRATYTPPTTQSPSVLGASTVAADPNALVGNTGLTAAQIASTNSQIDQGLGQLGAQGDVGNRNILNSYNSAFQTLLGGKNAALAADANNRTSTTQDNINAKAGIDDSVSNQTTGLQRLLGSAGAGNSSAARDLIPFLAAKQGSQQRAGVQNTFATNMNAIDNADAAVNNQFDNGVGSLNNDRQTKQNALQSGLNTTKANLLQQRANLLAASGQNYGSVQSQIGSLLSGVTQLGLNPTFTPQTIAPAPLDLAKYATPASQAATINPSGTTAASQAAGPYYSLINSDQQKKAAAGVA